MPFLSWDPTVDDDEFSSSGAYQSISVPEGVYIPLLDKDAWVLYPDYSHLYNKLWVNRSSGVNCDLIGSSKIPEKYPVIVRPVYNLFGMGHEARIVTTPQEIVSSGLSGYFWAESLNGQHLSWDIAIQQGIWVWHQAWRGQPHAMHQPGVMSYWSTQDPSPASASYVQDWVAEHLEGFTGMINLETIGGKIIECHLRIGDALYLRNPKLLQAVVDLYSRNEWTFDGENQDFHMFPIWGRRGPGLTKLMEGINLGHARDMIDMISRSFELWAIETDLDWAGDPVAACRLFMLGTSNFNSGRVAQKYIQALVDRHLSNS